MPEHFTYAVYFHPQALDALGAAIKPYLTESPEGPHILCNEIDTSGAFCEMTEISKPGTAKPLEIELMVPSSMVRLVVSVSGDEVDFGFG